MNELSVIETAINRICSSYCSLSDKCQSDFRCCSKVLTADKGTILVKEGQYSDKVYYILNGAARAYYLKDGKDISDWFAFENDFISSVNSFFQEVPSPHYIEIMEPAVLLELSKQEILLLTDKFHEFERLIRIVVTKTMLQLQQRIVAVQFETAQQKYENLLKARPDITQRVALTHIASYLGITLETLSRIRHPKRGI